MKLKRMMTMEDEEDNEKITISSDEETDSESEEEEEGENNVDNDNSESQEETRIQKITNTCKIFVNKIRNIVKKYNRSNPLRLYVLDLKAEKGINENFYHDFKVRKFLVYKLFSFGIDSITFKNF